MLNVAAFKLSVENFFHDPLGFVCECFPWGSAELPGSPEKWQVDILIEIRNKLQSGASLNEVVKIAIASGHGIGKSALIAWIVFWAMATHDNCRGVITAGTERQLLTKTWPEIAKWFRFFKYKDLFKLQATRISADLPNYSETWRIDIIPWNAANPDAFAGMHNKGSRILVVFDESSAIADKIWEVTEGALTDKDTEIIWCAFGNPTLNSGMFRECFRKNRHRWITRQIDSRLVSITNKRQIQKWIDDHGFDSDFVKVRVRGIFPNASSLQFIAQDVVDAARGRRLDKKSYEFAPVILTCDPAWTGDDTLVIAKRQGLKFDILRVIPRQDDDFAIAKILADYEDEFKADAVFIDIGWGTGIFSGGKQLGRKWILVNNANASLDPGYLNVRAESWAAVKKWLKEGGALPDDQELCDDLVGPQFSTRPDGKVVLESKADMKKRGIPSPNKGDALALSFAGPVRKGSGLKLKPKKMNGWV